MALYKDLEKIWKYSFQGDKYDYEANKNSGVDILNDPKMPSYYSSPLAKAHYGYKMAMSVFSIICLALCTVAVVYVVATGFQVHAAYALLLFAISLLILLVPASLFLASIMEEKGLKYVRRGIYSGAYYMCSAYKERFAIMIFLAILEIVGLIFNIVGIIDTIVSIVAYILLAVYFNRCRNKMAIIGKEVEARSKQPDNTKSLSVFQVIFALYFLYEAISSFIASGRISYLLSVTTYNLGRDVSNIIWQLADPMQILFVLMGIVFIVLAIHYIMSAILCYRMKNEE